MHTTAWRRSGIAAVLSLSLVPMLFAPAQPPAKPKAEPAFPTEFYKGKVIPLKDALEKHGVQLDADTKEHWLALATDDGKLFPLIKDDASRMFFKDARLLNRPMRLTGRLVADTKLLQVVNVHSLKDGQLHDVYYWCDICAIKRYERKNCDCCGAPMELREVPAKK